MEQDYQNILRKERLGGYINLMPLGQTNFTFSTVNNTRIYYQDNGKQTIKQISQKYQETTGEKIQFKTQNGQLLNPQIKIDTILQMTGGNKSQNKHIRQIPFESIQSQSNEQQNKNPSIQKKQNSKTISVYIKKIKENKQVQVYQEKKQKQLQIILKKRIQQEQLLKIQNWQQALKLKIQNSKKLHSTQPFQLYVKFSEDIKYKCQKEGFHLTITRKTKFQQIAKKIGKILNNRISRDFVFQVNGDLIISQLDFQNSLQSYDLNVNTIICSVQRQHKPEVIQKQIAQNRIGLSYQTPIIKIQQKKQVKDILGNIKEGDTVLSYNTITENVVQCKVTNLKATKIKESFETLEIFFSNGEKIRLISGERILSMRGQWMHIHMKDLGNLKRTPFMLWSLEQKKMKKVYINEITHKPNQIKQTEQTFIKLTVQPFHNFNVNGIFVHNQFSFNLIIKDPFNESQQIVTVMKSQKISEKTDKRIFVSGIQLKRNYSVGDYQLEHCKKVIGIQQNHKIQQIKKQIHLMIHIWRDSDFNSYVFPFIENSYQILKDKYAKHYLCLNSNQIFDVQQLSSYLINFQKKYSHVRLVDILMIPKSEASRLCLYSHMQTEFQSEIQQTFNTVGGSYEDVLTQSQKFKSNIKTDLVAAIYLYTTNTCYKKLNQQLYGTIWQMTKPWLNYTSLLIKALDNIQNYKGITFRGINNIKLSQLKIQTGKVINFGGFTSTSTNVHTASGFAGSNGALLFQKGISGKSIEAYSDYPDQKQVLFPPSTFWYVQKIIKDGNRDKIWLQQLIVPRGYAPNIIFWVDDQPSNNSGIIQSLFSGPEYQVLQITSTKLMKVILENFFWILRFKNKKMVIVSDMVRLQNDQNLNDFEMYPNSINDEIPGNWNYYAGVDLLQILRKDYGFSTKILIFTSDQDKAHNNIKQRNLVTDNYVITQCTSTIIKQIQKQFQEQ